ncbi:MAG: FliI/YscN family ATPase, partial [Anaplasmataceae bacterium]|nr:FliI/YscN family ATPase [Anaplasmataceae bacterium]
KYPLYSNKNVIPIDERDVFKKRMSLGVKGIDSFLPCCYGQRMGIFAGSGVGKSTLVSMVAGFAEADIKIIGLIGERSRELREFIDNYLHTMENTIVVVSTGNESPMLRKRCTYLTVTLAEYFRDQGKEVLCILDSITRFAHAQREIGIAMGEPPTSRSYTPSTFTQLPILLERTGIGKKNHTSITTLLTVLVDGDDDIEDPIADAVRGILDGHIVLNRNIANSGRFPAIDIIKSVSRSFLNCTTEEEQKIIREARKKLNLYEEMKDMIRIGAYKKGDSEEIDDAIDFYHKIENFLSQSHSKMAKYTETIEELAKILNN